MDPRILWISRDKVWAVVNARDVPRGVDRTGSYTQPNGIELVLRVLYSQGALGLLYVGPRNGGVCGVQTEDLARDGWDLVVNGTFVIPPDDNGPRPRAVKEWPASCPRCGQGESAVVLFSSWECRHGCHRRAA